MSGDDHQLSKVATLTNHLAIVGNFVGAAGLQDRAPRGAHLLLCRRGGALWCCS
jgi:hypothetical protein